MKLTVMIEMSREDEPVHAAEALPEWRQTLHQFARKNGCASAAAPTAVRAKTQVGAASAVSGDLLQDDERAGRGSQCVQNKLQSISFTPRFAPSQIRASNG